MNSWVRISTRRNKTPDKKSLSTLKKGLFKESNRCAKCNLLSPPIGCLCLDHIFPIYLGGEVFEKSNHQLLCRSCHLKKTIFDKKVIHFLKSIGVLRNGFSGENEIYCSDLNEIKEFYNKWYERINEDEIKWGEKW